MIHKIGLIDAALRIRRLILVACLVSFAIAAESTRAEKTQTVFIKNGSPRAVREIGKKWTPGEGALMCHGIDNFLIAGKAVATGDFRIRARLKLDQLNSSGASMMIGGNHFGFDGSGTKLFIEGPAFGPTRMLGDAGKFITPGKTFDVEVMRKGTTLSLLIDGKEIHTGKYKLSPVCAIALRPHRATMRLYDFSANGKMTELTNKVISQVSDLTSSSIEINGLEVKLNDLPKGLVIPDGLGLIVPPTVQGKMVYKAKHFSDCPRALVTPKGDYLMMSPVGEHYGRDLKTKCNDMMAFRSKDKGKTWSGPTVAYEIDYSQHGFIPLVPKGSKRIYNFGTQPITESREGMENSPIGFRHSDDDGYTWSKVTIIKPVNDPEFRGMSCMRMTETDTGTWLLGSHEADWTKQPLQTRQYILRSEDKGKTWTVGPEPRHDGWFVPGFGRMDEGRPIALGDGKVLLMARTPEGHLWAIRSKDDGKTWSKPVATPLIHPDAPPMLFHLSDGKTLAAFHHNRHGDSVYTTLDSNKGDMMKDRQEVWVSLSTDEGHTWSKPRFVYANAMTKKLQNPWLTYNCSYLDLFIDDGILNLFLTHRWSRLLHLQIAEKDLFTLPTREEFKAMLK